MLETIRLAWDLVRHERWRLFSLFFAGLLLYATSNALNPLIIMWLFDEGIIAKNFRLFILLALGAIVFFMIIRWLTYLYTMALERMTNRLQASGTLKTIRTLLKKPYRAIATLDPGYLMARVDDDIRQSLPPLVQLGSNLMTSAATFIAGLTVALSLSWRMTLILLLVVPLLYRLADFFGKHIAQNTQQEQEQDAHFRAVLQRVITAWKSIHLFHLEPMVRHVIHRTLSDSLNARLVRIRNAQRYNTISAAFISIGETAVIIGGGYEVLRGRMTFGAFMGFMNAFWITINGLNQLNRRLPDLARLSGVFQRLHRFLEIPPEPSNIERSDHIALDGVSFSWNNHEVLTDIHLIVHPGERILLYGPNGSGKTTLAHLLAGLLAPSRGTVYTLPPNRISAVLSPLFFPPVPGDELLRQIEQTEGEGWQWASRLGLDPTTIDDPENLSSGQKKRLEIALGLTRLADFYIFDEPLSGIDEESRNHIMETIFKRTQGKRLVIISHEVGHWIHAFDRVFLIANGHLKLEERSSHSAKYSNVF